MPRSSFSKTFFKIFPPPAFIDMPYAGIDISDNAVHCLQFRKNRASSRHGTVNLGPYGVAQLSPGVVESGYIKDEAALTAAIAGLVKKLGVVRVKASLPEEKVYLFRTDIPSLNTVEIAQNIESKLEENVPLSPADAIFHFRIISAGGSATARASVSVVPAKVVETYMRVLKNAGVAVFSFEMQARAVAHAMIPRDSEETVMIVYGDASGKKAGIYVVYHKVVCFTVTIPVASDPGQDVFKGMKEVMAYWSDHGEGNEPRHAVNRIVVCGSDTLRTAVENASRELGLPVSAANVWTNAFSTEKDTPAITADESVGYAVVAGLALPEIRYPTGDTRLS